MFKLQPKVAELSLWSQKWVGRGYGPKEKEGLEWGKRLVAGERTIELLRNVCKWKSPRGIRAFDENIDQHDVSEAISLALDAKQPRCAIAVLTGLHGVNARMASAILTMMKPRDYTVIDVLSLRALGVRSSIDYLRHYPAYLDACRAHANAAKLTLRELDHALWLWGREH